MDGHVDHLHGHVGVVEGGVQEGGDRGQQEEGRGGGHQGGHQRSGAQQIKEIFCYSSWMPSKSQWKDGKKKEAP